MVNIVGLSVGLASVMALLVGVYMYVTTDNIHTDKDRMYFLKSKSAEGKEFMQTTYPLLDEIIKTCPEVEAGTHTQSWSYPWLKYGTKETQGTTSYVDTGFFGVFSFPLKYGNASVALKDKFSVVISEKIATELFGNENPIGKTISADDSISLTVTGVLKPIPTNSSVRGEVFLTTDLLKDNPNFKNNADWYNGFATNFLKLKPNTDIAAFDAKIAKLVALNYAPTRKTDKVFSVPFSKMKDEAGPIVNVIIKGSVGTSIFILLILLVNLLNLNTASLYNRSKEVAVRQIIGSGKINIVKQFCLENALIIGISMVIASFLFMTVLFPKMNELYGSRFGEISLNMEKDYPFMIVFLIVGIILTLLAGTLPAMKLISVKVADAIKGRLSTTVSSHRLRNIFIALQFTLAITFICITIILNQQINFMKQASPGFNKDEVVVVSLDLAFKNPKSAGAHFQTVLNSLKSNAYVKAVSVSEMIPTAYQQNYNSYIDPATNKELSLQHSAADAAYLSAFEIPVVNGRNFDDALEASEENSVMINRTAMKAFGWTDVKGKQLREKSGATVMNVIGVMEDFHYADMQQAIEPLLHWYGGKQHLQYSRYLNIRIEGNHKTEVLQKLKSEFKAMPSRRDFDSKFMADLVNKQYLLIDGISKTTNFVALLTIIVSCMGMFGLISLFTKQRVKEIGIRIVLGADISQIVGLVSKDFIRLVIIACLIALPVAGLVMHNWLQDFAYRIDMQWWMFLLAACLALLIAFITVGYQAIKAATVNPVQSLRTE